MLFCLLAGTRSAAQPAADYKAAVELYEAGEYAEARQRCTDILMDDADFAPAQLLRAYCAMQSGDILPMAIDLEATRKALGQQWDWLFAHGNYLTLIGKYEEAIRDYTAVTVQKPGHVLAWNNRGNAYQNLKQYKNALADYYKAISLDSSIAVFYNNRGSARYLLANGQQEPANARELRVALEDVDKALRLQSDLCIAQTNRGLILEYQTRFEEAVKQFESSLTCDSTSKDAWMGLARNNAHTGNYAEATDIYEQLLKTYPDDKRIALDLATVYGKSGQVDEAFGKLNLLAKNKGWKGVTAYRKAIIMASQGDTLQTIKWLKAARKAGYFDYRDTKFEFAGERAFNGFTKDKIFAEEARAIRQTKTKAKP